MGVLLVETDKGREDFLAEFFGRSGFFLDLDRLVNFDADRLFDIDRAAARATAEKEKVDVRTYRVIYNAIEDVEAAMKGLFKPVFKEVEMGRISVRNTFKISGVGTIAGAYVQDGKVARNAQVRVVRDGVVVYDGKISSLKRFKDDVKEVAAGYECGISFENFNDVHEGDVIEAYTMEQVER